MAVRILKLWHQWSWAAHLVGYAVLVGSYFATYPNAIANNSADIAAIKAQHLAERIATQEQFSKDTHDDIASIKNTEAQIFERLNQLADRR